MLFSNPVSCIVDKQEELLVVGKVGLDEVIRNQQLEVGLVLHYLSINSTTDPLPSSILLLGGSSGRQASGRTRGRA